MRCPTTTEQLVAYLDDTADPSVIEHISSCQECQRRANQLANAQQRFSAKLAGNDCPSTMDLGEYHLRMNSQTDRGTMRQHVRRCPNCLERLNQLAAQVDLPASPNRKPFTSAICYPAIAQTAQMAQMAQSLRGSSVGSSARSTDTPAMDYMIDLGKISIRLARSTANNNLVDITGLMLGVQAPFNKVNLLVADTEQEVASVAVNRLGGFTIEGVLSGEYDLQLVAESEFSVLLREFNI